MVGQLVPGCVEDDPLKVFGLDVAVAISVEEVEGLPDALPLQTTEHLGELWVGHIMPPLLPPNIKTRPFAVPIKGDAIVPLVELVQFLKVVVLDDARARDIEESEGYLVFGIGLCEEVLEGSPVLQVDLAGSSTVSDIEENGVLFPLDLVLRRSYRSLAQERLPGNGFDCPLT